MELPSSVRAAFATAGWAAPRQVTVPPVVPRQHPAYEILTEFGGLKIGQVGRGEECAKSALTFEYVESNPAIPAWADLLQSQLIGVAEIDNGHAELYVDASGRFFFASCIHDAFAFAGVSFGEAMECVLLGRRSKPMLRPDQSSIEMWGEVFTSDDPRVYTYR
jgi:SUKH-3 immunity protein of toxin-antitoxin system